MKTEHNVYAPPDKPVSQSQSASQTLSKFFSIAGVAVAILPVPFFLVAIFTMLLDADRILDEAQGDPSIVSGHISQALVPVVVSVVVGMAGFLAAICAAGLGSYRARWFFWAMVVVAVIYTPAVPLGTLLAIVCGTVLYRKYTEFFPPISTVSAHNDA